MRPITTMDLGVRYWVFVYSDYYPSGGIEDISAVFESLDEAFSYCNDLVDAAPLDIPDDVYILDSLERRVVQRWRAGLIHV